MAAVKPAERRRRYAAKPKLRIVAPQSELHAVRDPRLGLAHHMKSTQMHWRRVSLAVDFANVSKQVDGVISGVKHW